MKFDRRIADALYRVNFGAFAYAAYEVVHPHEPLCPNWHIDCICHHLAAMEAGRLPARLIVNLPPRSLKSYLVSVAWVPHALIRRSRPKPSSRPPNAALGWRPQLAVR